MYVSKCEEVKGWKGVDTLEKSHALARQTDCHIRRIQSVYSRMLVAVGLVEGGEHSPRSSYTSSAWQ